MKSDLTYEERPVRVIDTRERVTRSHVVKFYKVMWSNQGSESDATWEWEDYLKDATLPFIQNGMLFKSWDEIFIRGEGCNTLGVRLA